MSMLNIFNILRHAALKLSQTQLSCRKVLKQHQTIMHTRRAPTAPQGHWQVPVLDTLRVRMGWACLETKRSRGTVRSRFLTSDSVSSIMDVKLNTLKYLPLGQLEELLMLSLTGLRNTGVIIPSHQLARWLPRVSSSLSRYNVGGEKKLFSHTNSSAHFQKWKYTQPSVRVSRLLSL